MVGGELGISFQLPIIIPSPQHLEQRQKHHKWIPLGLKIVLPPIFLKIVQELTENGAIDGDGGMDDFVLGGRYQLSRAREFLSFWNPMAFW